MAKQPQRRLVVLLERCDAVATVTPSRATPHLPRSPKVELIDCLSLARSLARRAKVRRKSNRAKKKKKETSDTAKACDSELRCDSIGEQLVDEHEESAEPTSVSKDISVPTDTDPNPPTSEDDQLLNSTEPLAKPEIPEPIRAPERLSLFDQMPLLLLENDDFFPAPEDPLLVDPATLMIGGGGEALAVEMGSRNSSFSGEFPTAEFIHELNNDVMLADVANRSMLLEVEELLVPGGAVTMETSAVENVEFGQNDFAIDDGMDWSCEQPWPLLEPGANLPDGHGPLNSSLEAGDSDDEFGQRMREEFLARRLRCSTRLQNLQRRSAERSLSESDNLDSDGKIVIRKRSREVPNIDVPSVDVPNLDAPNLEVPNLDVQDELFIQKKSKIRRIHSKLNTKVVVPIAEPAASEVDGKTEAAEFPTKNLEDENNVLSVKGVDGLALKKGNRKDRPSMEAKATLTSQNEVENLPERKNSFRVSAQSSDDGKSVRKLVDVPAEEGMSMMKKPSSKAKENKLMSEKVSTNDPKLSKSLLSSVEAAKLKYMLMKKERDASELKESNSEDKAKKTKDGVVKNPCREPGCSASTQPDSIFCSPECLSQHVNESIKLLAQDRVKTYNRGQDPGHSGISEAAKATERIVVFERKTGKLVTGPLAPTESSLLAWLQRHPTFEVLQPEQAIGHVSGNLKNRKKKPLLQGDRRNGADPSTGTRVNLSGVASSDRTQKTSGTETKMTSSGKSQTAVTNATRPDSTSNNRSHADEKLESDEHLDPLRLNTRSELRHLLLDRLDRNVSTSRVKRLALEIECELWTAGRRSSSLYKQKFSGLVRILKRQSSQDLCRRLFFAEMKPRQLLQQMKELQRSDASITKNSMVNPLDLQPGLVDTTDRHGDHIFDVGCRICSGQQTRINECDRLQPPTSSDTACNNKVSSDLDGNASKPQVSSQPENGIVEGGSYEANGTDAVALIRRKSVDGFARREVEMPAGGVEALVAVVSMDSSPAVTSEVDSKTTSHDLLPSTLPSPSTVTSSPGISSAALESSNASSSRDSLVVVSSPSLTTSSISTRQSIPVPSSCRTSSNASSLDRRLSNIPSGSSSNVPAPSVELPPPPPTCPPTPNGGSTENPITNVDQVQFVFSPMSTRTSAPGTSLSTSSSLTVAASNSSIETKLLSSAPVSTRHSSAEMSSSSPSKHHPLADVRSGSEGLPSGATTSSRPQGLNRLKSTTTSMSNDTTLVDLVWKGSVSALDGATMQLCAYRTSGSMQIVRSVLPAMVTVMGRIDPKTVDDYLQKIRQQYTATREIAVICFHCNDDSERPKYNQLFNYLHERRRCGVIGSIGSAIKDMYIWPLPAGVPIPSVLLPFNGPGLDVNRRDVLLGIVIQQAVRSRGHAGAKHPTTSTNPIHSSVAAPKNNAKISADPAAPSAQDNLSRSSALKNESGSSATNDESSDDVSDDDLKAFAQADPIVSKYSKARPQDLLVQAKTEDLDKPYDPFDEDYEIDPTQNRSRREVELNGLQKLTEAVYVKLDTQRQQSETSSEIHSHTDPLESLTKDAMNETDESQHGNKNDSKTTKRDVDAVLCPKPHESSNLNCADKSVNSRKTSIDIQNTEETSSPKLSSVASEKSQVPSNELSSAKPSTNVSHADNSETGVTANSGSVALGTAVGHPGVAIQSPEASNPDTTGADETLTNIAMMLKQLSEKNALTEENLRLLLDQLLSVYGAQNDRQQRAILLQLVETIEKQHSLVEKEQSVTAGQQSVTERRESMTENQPSVMDMEPSAMERQQSVSGQQQVVAKNETGVEETVPCLSDNQRSETTRQQNVCNVTMEEHLTDDSKSLLQPGEQGLSLICPESNKGQNGLMIARSESSVERKEDPAELPLMDDNLVSIWQRRQDQKSGAMSTGEKTCKDFVAENKGVVQTENKSQYPAMYQTDIQSFPSTDDEPSEQRFDGYGMDWFSAAYGREPGWNSEKRPNELDGERQGVPTEGGSTAPPLRSCLKKKKLETAIDDPRLNIEQILPVLSDSSFETLKSIVMSANSAEMVPTNDSRMESRPQVHSEGQHHPMTTKTPLNVLTNTSFCSPPSFSPHLSSPPFPVHQSPERSLLSPTSFPNAGRLPAPPKPPPCLLPGSQIRGPVPEAFIEPPNARAWAQTYPPHPGFQSPTMYEPYHRVNLGGGGNARFPFSPPPPPPPPWEPPEEPSFPTFHSRWLGSYRDVEDRTLQGRGCFPARSSYDAPTQDWSYAFDSNSRQRNPAADTQPFWQSGIRDTSAASSITRSQNSNNHERYLIAERARDIGNAFACDDFTGTEMIERNFGRCNNDGSHFPSMETMPQQPLFPHDQDYRQPFCEGGTKSLIESTYNDRGFHENSYEFFGSVLEDGGNFGSLGELLPGLGGLEGADFPERIVDLCDPSSSSQTDGNEAAEKVEDNESNGRNGGLETAALTKEINNVLDSASNKPDVSTKIKIANKTDGVATIRGDSKTDLNINNDDDDVKTESVAKTTVETRSQVECSAESKLTVDRSPSDIHCKTSPSLNKDHETLAMSESSQKTVDSLEVIDKAAASEQHHGADDGDSLCEALASLNALIERCAESDVGPEGGKASGVLQELCESNNDVRLIDDVRDLVRKCLDADLLNYSEVCDGLGVSLQLLAEKGVLVDEKALPRVDVSCGEIAGGNGESRSRVSSEQCGSPKSVESGNGSSSKSGRNSCDVERRGLYTTDDPRPQEMYADCDAAALINESDDFVIDIADDDDDDVLCSADVSQTALDGGQKVTTDSTPDRVAAEASHVHSEADDEPSLSVRDPLVHVGRRTESCDSGESIEMRRGRHGSRSRRLLRDSDNSCDSVLDKRRHRHDSRDSSKQWRHHDNTKRYRQDSAESGSYPRHRVISSGDTTVIRKRSHDSSSHSRKRSRRDCDSDRELEELWLSTDEEEEKERRRTYFYSRCNSSSHQSSESDTQRARNKPATAFIVDDSRRFVDARLSRNTHPSLGNGLSLRKAHGMRYGRASSPGERERRRDRSGGKRSTDVDERTLRKFWKESRAEECFNADVEKRCRSHRNSSEDRNGDRGERHRRTERTHDPRSRHKEDVIGSKRDDSENVGLTAFAGFISRRIPVEVETEIAWSRDEDELNDGMRGGGALDNRNLIDDVDTDTSRVVGGSVGQKTGSRVSRDCGVRSRHHDKPLERVGCVVTEKSVGNALTVDGVRQTNLCSRELNSSECGQQGACTEPVHMNSCLGRSCVSRGNDEEAGHLLSAGQLMPGGLQQIRPGILHGTTDVHPTQNLHRPQHNNGPSHLSEHRRSRPSPRKQLANVSIDEDLEDGEIVDAPDEKEKEWPSATRDLLALLNTSKSWVSPGASIAPLSRQQPGGPSKT